MKLLVVDAYYRGAGFAFEAASLGFDVEYLDLTSSLGGWLPEDWEGPFGYFRTTNLSRQQNHALNGMYATEKLPQGFTLLSEGVPYEFQGPLIDFHVKTKFTESTKGFLCSDEPFKDVKDLFGSVPAMVASSFAATSDEPKMHKPLPLFEDYCIRRPLRTDFNGIILKLKQACKYRFNTEEISFSDNTSIVSFVNSMTLTQVAPYLSDELSAKGELTPIYQWSRYSYNLDTQTSTQEWPSSFVVLSDSLMPWVEQNFMVIQKSGFSGWWDVWQKETFDQNTPPNIYEEQNQSIISKLKEILPIAGIKAERLPSQSSGQTKGVPAPVFSDLEQKKWKTKSKVLWLAEEKLIRQDLGFRAQSASLALASLRRPHINSDGYR